jgi:hypothetical protein
MAGTEPTWTLTRSQLTDALAAIELRPVLLPGRAEGAVAAESMADAILAQMAPVRTYTEYAVAWRDEDPNRGAVVDFYDDEQDAAEHAALYPGGYPVWRPVYCGQWERLSPAPGAATDGPGHGETGHAEAGHVNAVPEGTEGREPPPYPGHFGGF